jgi:hypothetical protein
MKLELQLVRGPLGSEPLAPPVLTDKRTKHQPHRLILYMQHRSCTNFDCMCIDTGLKMMSQWTVPAPSSNNTIEWVRVLPAASYHHWLWQETISNLISHPSSLILELITSSPLFLSELPLIVFVLQLSKCHRSGTRKGRIWREVSHSRHIEQSTIRSPVSKNLI